MTPAVSFIGRSGSGKTTLLVRLIPLLREKGLRVGSVKRSHHEIEIDREGKDSWLLKQAGADPVIAAGGNLWALIKSTEEDLRLTDLLERIAKDVDLVLVEGFKNEEVPSIVVMRREIGWDPELPGKENCIGVVADCVLDTGLPRFSFNDDEKIANFIMEHIISGAAPR
ncbi:MAG: molybdopterin-guanine dinucleotide biosynthesis protein B [Nitrospinae bacterium]|nr:molybdopterin-guanine dinucleotide biosynthesis protein B [Nitrospinota bacterium]